MKNILILTWFSYNNYGTVLQAFALQKTLFQMGYTNDIANYIPFNTDYKVKMEKIFNINSWKNLFLRYRYGNLEDSVRCDKFDEFRNVYLKLSQNCNTKSELMRVSLNYKELLCGSDQIWSPLNYNSKYFLAFANDLPKIAYAPSFGVDKIKNKDIKLEIKKELEKFQYLSVREEAGQKIVYDLINKKIPIVLDPTLLLNAKEWNKYLNLSNDLFENKCKFILCYFLGNNEYYWNHVKEMKRNFNLTVLIIPINSTDKNRGYECLNGVGPTEFVEYIRRSSLVCTDSFHATVFSIQYHTPFYVFERFKKNSLNSQNSRIYNILKMTKLEDRIIIFRNKNMKNYSKAIDFAGTSHLVEQERTKSLQFLKESLDHANCRQEIKKEIKKEITNTCCGCSVCSMICPTNAINMEIGKQGFWESKIITEKCIGCDLCKKVCPFNGEVSLPIKREGTFLYMAYSKNKEVIEKSTSGGVGFEIAQFGLKNEFPIVGCKYNYLTESAEHICIFKNEKEKLKLIQGSKYIQSNFKNSEDVIRNYKKGVIFGTPCQIAGTSNLLKLQQNRDNFILVELICHGVPTINLWRKYLKQKKKNLKIKYITNINFRDQKPCTSWQEKYISIHGEKKQTYRFNSNKDDFYLFFNLNNCLMPSCYECNYRENSKADIRIGDYWGREYKDVSGGVNMVLTLTTVGDQVIRELKSQGLIEAQKNDVDEYWKIQIPKNPIRPLYYSSLMESLSDKPTPLHKSKKIFKKYIINYRLAQIYLKCRK